MMATVQCHVCMGSDWAVAVRVCSWKRQDTRGCRLSWGFHPPYGHGLWGLGRWVARGGTAYYLYTHGGVAAPQRPRARRGRGGRGFGTELNPQPYGPGPKTIQCAGAHFHYAHIHTYTHLCAHMRIVRTVRRAFGCFFEPRPPELIFLT